MHHRDPTRPTRGRLYLFTTAKKSFLSGSAATHNIYAHCSSELVDPLAGLAQRLALLLVDLGETLSSHFPGLGVSHTKHIVGLNSPIHATVAGNGLAEGLDCLVGLWWGYLEECRARLVLRLRLDNLLTGSNQSLSVVFLCVQIGFFLC